MKLLLLPANNTLSHIAKCLALRACLAARDHVIRLAASRRHAPFLERLRVPHLVLPDIQEGDHGSIPSMAWFEPDRFATCVRAEAEAIRAFKPDRVLGIFCFTAPASTRLAGVPYDSLICGCMIPECRDVLGFDWGEPGIEAQARGLALFRRHAARLASVALARLGLPRVEDAYTLLKGERTFLWDFQEFLPLAAGPDVTHVGPITWDGWPRDGFDPDRVAAVGRPLALVALGTGWVPPNAVTRIVRVLLQLGYGVVLAAGGQRNLVALFPGEPRVAAFEFVPIGEVLPLVSLVICHGGQMLVFEALRHAVPVVVMPLQPEQAHNGVCLERIGCGRRLVPPRPFLGDAQVYLDTLGLLTDADLTREVRGLVEGPDTARHLARMSAIIRGYDGVGRMAGLLEGA